MQERFKDRHFLITGGASGIGLATARLLKERGACLSIWDVSETGLQEAGLTLDAHTSLVDITRPDQVEQEMDVIIRQQGPLDGVIHAAGIMRTGRFEETSLLEHRRMVETNLFGTVLVAYMAVASLKVTRGSLILLSSISAFYGPPEFATYGASKAGVLSFAQAIRLELEEVGVHVGVVCPFFVATPMIADQQTRLFRRFGVAHTPEAVARAIVNGVSRRRFMIWPGLQPVLFHWLSHVAYPVRHAFMRFFWR